jgi:hypothetical protein
MGQHDFKNDAVEMRVDVTLLREGLNAVRGLCLQLDGNNEATIDDYKTIMLQIDEVCQRTLWKEVEAKDAGFVGGWLPHGSIDVEIINEDDKEV